MLSNRNVQAEWASRLDIEITKTSNSIEGNVQIRNGHLTHMFPGGDPVLKQFLVKVTLKDRTGKIIGENRKRFGRSFAELLRGQIPQPLVNGGTTRHIPFRLTVPAGSSPALIEASMSYALIPEPGAELKNRYLATIPKEKARQEATRIIEEYTSYRLLTFRTKSLETTSQQLLKNS
jgi:hypothetical protein